MMLPPEALRRRISRVQALVAYLDRLKPVDLETYEADIALQLRIERVVQLLSQALVDVGSSLLDYRRRLEGGSATPGDAANSEPLMAALSDAGVLDSELARRLVDLTDLAEVLVHEHVEVDPRDVWRAWSERRQDFAAAASGFATYLSRHKVLFQA